MKKIIYIIILILFNAIIISGSYFLIINKGNNIIKEANNIKILTDEDLEKEKEKIELKKQEVIDKYSKEKEELKANAQKQEEEIDAKYKALIEQKRNSATKSMGEDGWFEETTRIQREISELESKASKEKQNLNTWEKEIEIEKKKNNEIFSIEEIYEKKSQNKEAQFKKNQKKVAGIIVIIIGSLIIVIDISIMIGLFNKLIRLKNKVNTIWAQIDVSLKKRYDLIPNLVNVVKGYVTHEKETLSEIMDIRSKAINDTDISQAIENNKRLDNQINKIIALNERYPELKANQNYLQLMNDLRNIENEISANRTNYNNVVNKYKNARETIPTNIIAYIANFQDIPFYNVNDEEKQNVKVEM